MSAPDANLIAAALTRATVRRDVVGVVGSDEELLRRLGMEGDPKRVDMMVGVSRVLRLMDALLAGVETGEGFVEKLAMLWGSLKQSHSGNLADQTVRLDAFYGDIQLYCASERDRSEDPLLFGIKHLKALTAPVYADLKRWWLRQLHCSLNSAD